MIVATDLLQEPIEITLKNESIITGTYTSYDMHNQVLTITVEEGKIVYIPLHSILYFCKQQQKAE